MAHFSAAEAAALIAVPGERDDKYSRGVLGLVTGSNAYSGAAVLSAEAALRTGVGMLRYVGDEAPALMVLARRPEVVWGTGRVQAWVVGSGMVDDRNGAVAAALDEGVPVVIDAGALDLLERRTGPAVITPHAGELSRLLGVSRETIEADPARAARDAADDLGVTVLLKGHTTYVAGPGGMLSTQSAPTWLATAGAGDALAGILGALVATHTAEIERDERMLTRLAATASVIHGLAAHRASQGGPFTILDLCEAISPTVAELVARRAV
jgi:hydroxyethylthiazole kinase-like uncharacterized protein yjeF